MDVPDYFLENDNHSNSGKENEHIHSPQGHRSKTQNATSGRLIDRQAMIDKHKGCNNG